MLSWSLGTGKKHCKNETIGLRLVLDLLPQVDDFTGDEVLKLVEPGLYSKSAVAVPVGSTPRTPRCHCLGELLGKQGRKQGQALNINFSRASLIVVYRSYLHWRTFLRMILTDAELIVA